MAIIQSAKKALRQSKRRKVFNDLRTRTMKSAIKGVRVAVKEKVETAAQLAAAYQAIDKAAKRGVIKKNTASRKKSRLAKSVVVKK